jgi:hypothetical protein
LIGRVRWLPIDGLIVLNLRRGFGCFKVFGGGLIPIAIKRRSGRTIVRSPDGLTTNPNRTDQDTTPLELALARGHRWLRML